MALICCCKTAGESCNLCSPGFQMPANIVAAVNGSKAGVGTGIFEDHWKFVDGIYDLDDTGGFGSCVRRVREDRGGNTEVTLVHFVRARGDDIEFGVVLTVRSTHPDPASNFEDQAQFYEVFEDVSTLPCSLLLPRSLPFVFQNTLGVLLDASDVTIALSSP